jgi:hypothetical protein
MIPLGGLRRYAKQPRAGSLQIGAFSRASGTATGAICWEVPLSRLFAMAAQISVADFPHLPFNALRWLSRTCTG